MSGKFSNISTTIDGGSDGRSGFQRPMVVCERYWAVIKHSIAGDHSCPERRSLPNVNVRPNSGVLVCLCDRRDASMQ